MKINKYFALIILLILFGQCRSNSDLQRISSTAPYFPREKFELDTTNIYRTSELKSKLINKDSLIGSYNFIVLSGYHGHILKLNKDSTFIEHVWMDVVRGRTKYLKGEWSLNDNYLILKDKKKNQFKFIYYQNSWTVFLIPIEKNKHFKIQLDKNKERIDKLKYIAKHIDEAALSDSISYLRCLCFYRQPIQRKKNN